MSQWLLMLTLVMWRKTSRGIFYKNEGYIKGLYQLNNKTIGSNSTHCSPFTSWSYKFSHRRQFSACLTFPKSSRQPTRKVNVNNLHIRLIGTSFRSLLFWEKLFKSIKLVLQKWMSSIFAVLVNMEKTIYCHLNLHSIVHPHL